MFQYSLPASSLWAILLYLQCLYINKSVTDILQLDSIAGQLLCFSPDEASPDKLKSRNIDKYCPAVCCLIWLHIKGTPIAHLKKVWANIKVLILNVKILKTNQYLIIH